MAFKARQAFLSQWCGPEVRRSLNLCDRASVLLRESVNFALLSQPNRLAQVC